MGTVGKLASRAFQNCRCLRRSSAFLRRNRRLKIFSGRGCRVEKMSGRGCCTSGRGCMPSKMHLKGSFLVSLESWYHEEHDSGVICKKFLHFCTKNNRFLKIYVAQHPLPGATSSSWEEDVASKYVL